MPCVSKMLANVMKLCQWPENERNQSLIFQLDAEACHRGREFISELPVTSENNANISHMLSVCSRLSEFSGAVTKRTSFSFEWKADTGAMTHDASDGLSDCLDFLLLPVLGQAALLRHLSNDQELLILYLQASTKRSQQQGNVECGEKVTNQVNLCSVGASTKCPNQRLCLRLWCHRAHRQPTQGGLGTRTPPTTGSPDSKVGWETWTL